jgi:hypothetical protein
MASGTLHVHAPEETASFLLVTAEYLFDSPHWLGNPTVYEAQLKVAASWWRGCWGCPTNAVDLDLLGGAEGMIGDPKLDAGTERAVWRTRVSWGVALGVKPAPHGVQVRSRGLPGATAGPWWRMPPTPCRT